MANRFFGERRHRWAIDTGEGTLFGYDGKTILCRYRRDAITYLKPARQFYRDARIVKVEIKYEVINHA